MIQNPQAEVCSKFIILPYIFSRITFKLAAVALIAVISVPAVRNSHPSDQSITNFQLSELRNGDLIFREGTGWRSQAVATGAESRWSHVGLVVIEADGQGWVVHAQPEQGPKNVVVKERLTQFASSQNAYSIGAYTREDLTDLQRTRTKSIALKHVSSRTPFDHDFDASERSRLYCTELVIDAYEGAGAPIKYRSTLIDTGLSSFQVIFPSHLLEDSQFKRVF